MGIVNVTPDSFSDGGQWLRAGSARDRALELAEQGADIIDIGGESSRPGAEPVSEEEEVRRVVPVVEAVRAAGSRVDISVDTVKYGVARAALQAGATMLNDISGLDAEPRLAELSAEFAVPLVLMHMQGTPRTMQHNPTYHDVVGEVYEALEKKIARARALGAETIYADVGIGFGKTLEHNLLLLAQHRVFTGLGVPLVLGISRKRFLGTLLGIEEPSARDVGTLAMHLLTSDSGADIVRVHNVVYMAQARALALALQPYRKGEPHAVVRGQ